MSNEHIDLYSILQVHPKAEPETITQVYRLMARKFHPDTAPAHLKSSFEDKMKQINSAYETLSKADARRQYDETSASHTDLNSYQVQFEIAAVLGETAGAGGGQRLCYERSAEILKAIIANNIDQEVIYEGQ